MNKLIFDNINDAQFLNLSFKNKENINLKIVISMLEVLKLLFSSFIFVAIAFTYISRKYRYLQRRNVTPEHQNYFMINCTYIFVVLVFASVFGLFSYYFPKITLVYLYIQTRNLN